MNVPLVLILLGLLVFISHLLADLFTRTGIPDILFLLGIGLLLGPGLNMARPEHFGMVGPVFTTVTLVIILFEGGLYMDLVALRSALRGSLGLSGLGFAFTLLVAALMARWALGLNWALALATGAAVGGTSSAVVIPLLRQLQLGEKTKGILGLESALTDVLCIVVALALISAHQEGHLALGLMTGRIVASFFMAALLGVGGALGWSLLLHRVRTIQHSLLTTPAFIFLIYGLVELLGYSGAIAALSFGVTLGNARRLPRQWIPRLESQGSAVLTDQEHAVFGEIVFLLKAFFFVYMGLSIPLGSPKLLLLGLATTLLVYLVRIPVVRIVLSPSLPPGDRALAAIMAPKGLAAAVLASLPLQLGLPGGELIRDFTFSVVLSSILLTTVGVFLLNRTPAGTAFSRLFGGPLPPGTVAS